MPKVPSIAPTVGPTVFQNFQASPDAFGAAQGAAQANIGGQLQQFGGQLIDQASRQELQRLERRSKKRQVELLRFSVEQSRKWKTLRGENAVNADAQFREDFDNQIQSMAEGLENPREIEDFAFLSERIKQREFARMDDHVINQERVADAEVDRALIDAKVDSIGENPLDADFVNEQIQAIQDITELRFNKEGITDEEVIFSAQKAATGDAIALSAKRLYTNNAALGQQYYDVFRERDDLLTPQHRIDIESGLNTAFRAERAEGNAAITLQQRLDKAERERVADEFLQQIIGAESPEDLATIKQLVVADTTLRAFGVGGKSVLIKMIDAPQNGESSLELDVFNRIHLPPSDPRHMDKDDVLTMGPRLGTKATRRILDDLVQADTPLGKAKKAFLDQFKTLITRSSLIGKDPIGDVNFGRFKQDVDRAIEQAQSDGVDPVSMFDNTNKEFSRVSNLWREYKRTMQEITASKLGEIQGQLDIGEPLPPPDSAEAQKLLRREGETVGEYLKRRGLE